MHPVRLGRELDGSAGGLFAVSGPLLLKKRVSPGGGFLTHPVRVEKSWNTILAAFLGWRRPRWPLLAKICPCLFQTPLERLRLQKLAETSKSNRLQKLAETSKSSRLGKAQPRQPVNKISVVQGQGRLFL